MKCCKAVTSSELGQLEQRVADLEARVEWLRGIALDRAGVAEDVKLVRERIAKLFVAEDGPEVRAAFERLVTRLAEGCGE